MSYEHMKPDEIELSLNRQTYEFSNTQLKGLLLNAFRRIANLERGARRQQARELKNAAENGGLGPRRPRGR